MQPNSNKAIPFLALLSVCSCEYRPDRPSYTFYLSYEFRQNMELTTCLSFWASRVHSAPSLLVISGKGKSGYLARICSRRSFRKRTYPVTGALGPFGNTFFLFFPFGQPLFFGCRERQQHAHELHNPSIFCQKKLP